MRQGGADSASSPLARRADGGGLGGFGRALVLGFAGFCWVSLGSVGFRAARPADRAAAEPARVGGSGAGKTGPVRTSYCGGPDRVRRQPCDRFRGQNEFPLPLSPRRPGTYRDRTFTGGPMRAYVQIRSLDGTTSELWAHEHRLTSAGLGQRAGWILQVMVVELTV